VFEGAGLDAAGAAPEAPEPSEAESIAEGRLSRLLAEIARLPAADGGESWTRLPRAGDVLGRYELLREIGRGGFGIVFEARDGELGRRVALKVLRPATGSRVRLGSEVLRREADAAARLNHPGIATLHDAGRWEGGPFLVYELLRGETLEERLRRGPPPVAEALRVARAIAAALAHAHAAGLLHRDLKPGNVFLCEDGRVKLLDLGLARVMGDDAAVAGGTPAFMAPEAWRREPEDPRADVFAAGVILHELLTGRVPYAVSGGRSAVLDGRPAPAPRVAGAPRALAALVRRAVSPDPAERPRDGRALEAELAAIAARIEAEPRRRRTALLVAAGAAAAAVTAGLAARVAWTPAPAPLPRVLAVADTVNETGERVVDGVSGLLSIGLERSPSVRVVPRERVAALLRGRGAAADAPLDGAALARVAGEAGIGAIVVPTVRRFGDVYQLDAAVLDARAGERLAGASHRTGGLSGVPALVDRASTELLQRLAGVEGGAGAPLDRVVTADLSAFQHYYEGMDCRERPSLGESWGALDCARHFEAAIAKDPTFALAHYERARLALPESGAPSALVRKLLAPALANLDRLPARERDLVLAWKAYLDGDADGALATYGRLAAAYPDDAYIPWMAGDVEYHRGRAAEALPWLERVLTLAPGHEGALDHRVRALGVLDDPERLAAVEAELARGPASPAAEHALILARAFRGDAPGALEIARRQAETGSRSARTELFALTVFAGDLGRAEATARERLAGAAPGAEPRARASLAAVLVQQGRWREARLELDRAEAAAAEERELAIVLVRRAHLMAGRRDPAELGRLAAALAAVPTGDAAPVAIHLAYAGDVAGAEARAGGLPAGSAARALYDAIVAWRRGDPSGAADRLAELRARSLADDLDVPMETVWLLHGEALHEAGRHPEAIRALGRLERLYAMNWVRPWALPRSRLLVARSLAASGRAEEARSELARLIAERARADGDDPVLVGARQLAAELARGERPPR
jgi:tetratricopeptide (TPR) repeat protein